MSNSSEVEEPLPEARVATIQIGNTDDRLSQKDWARFAAQAHQAIQKNVSRVHFRGGSDWDVPKQNACWVCEVLPDQLPGLREALRALCAENQQDSIALSVGDAEFLTAD